MSWLTSWWRQPDYFDWLSSYLQARRLTTGARRLLAIVAASLALLPLNLSWGPVRADGTLPVFVGAIAIIAALGFSALWLTRWPSKSQSIVFGTAGSAIVAGACLVQPQPLIALVGTAGLAVTGGYLAFFHSARTIALNFAIAVAVAGFAAYRVALDGQPIFAASLCFLVLELNLAVPLAIQIVVHALGVDVLHSDRDPLTGLLNRTAFQQAVAGVMLTHRRDTSYLAVAVVDLDCFKAFNDTHGHVPGDRALVAVGQALRERSSADAIIARIGGEEFVVADVVPTAIPSAMGQRLCDAVRGVQLPITASVGTSATALGTVNSDQAAAVLTGLVVAADTAMYTAKRGGGNATCHREYVPSQA